MAFLILLLTAVSIHAADGLEIAYANTSAIVRHAAFTLEYDEHYEQAKWVAYMLTRQNAAGKNARTNNFRVDPTVKTGSATPADYRGSGYDRGHLAPAADFKWSGRAMSETFFMSNMSPQKPSFNRDIWSRLEAQVRRWATEKDTLYIVTGGILKGSLPTIGGNVAVPEFYFKVILLHRPPIEEAIGFILPNAGSKKHVMDFAVSVDSVESATGIDFFPALPDTIEARVEGVCDPKRCFR